MRIAHISDIHIRNFKYHSEYEETFQELYRQLRLLKPDIIVNTGDTVHSKTQITPELVDMLGRHMISVSQIAPYVIVLGNHDLNLKNTDRRDAISPVVRALQDKHRVDLIDTSGVVQYHVENELINFWVFSLKDEEGWPTQRDWADHQDVVNVGLFHGAIEGCTTDMDWVMDDLEHNVEMFSGLDFVMMGDIHRHQTWNDGRIAYAGSLIQQNFGETPDKGFLVWDIRSRDDFEVRHVPLKTPLRFSTVKLDENMRFTETETVPNGAYVKVVTDASFTTSEQKEIVELTRARYGAKEIFVVSSPRGPNTKVVGTDDDGNTLDFSDPKVQERLLIEYLSELEIDDDLAAEVLNLDRSLQKEVESDEEFARGVTWKVNKVGWSNLMQYGEDNIIDFDKVRGVFGIFGPNSGGKSSVFETITEGLFDRVTKDVPKNIDLINDDRNEAKVVVDFTVDGVDYVIERGIERIKYGQRKKDIKEWGKTGVDFYRLSPDGTRTLLNGDSRPETERAIQRLIGGFEDFCMTSMTPQISVSNLPGGGDFINCKDTDRKKLLYRFLGLDVFERKALLAKEAMKDSASRLKQLGELNTFESELAAERVALLESSVKRLIEERNDLVREREVLQGRKNDLQVERNTLVSSISGDPADEAVVRSAVHKAMGRVDSARAELRTLVEAHRDVVEERRVEPTPVEDPTEEFQRVLKEIGAIDLALGKLEEQAKGVAKKIQILQEVPCGDQFPDCKFLRDAFEARGGIPAMKDENRRLRDIRSELQGQWDRVSAVKDLWEGYRLEQREYEMWRRNITSLELSMASEEKKVSNAEKHLDELHTQLKEIERNRETILKINYADRKIADVQRELTSLSGVIEKKVGEVTKHQKDMIRLEVEVQNAASQEKAIKGLRHEVDMYGLYVKAMGKNGIPHAILAEILPTISREINRVVASVSNFSVSLEADDEGQSLSLNMGYPSGKIRPVALGGGADKFIISLAIRAALSRLTNIPKSNMFIVDEGFGKLDPENAQAIQRMFTCLKSMFDHIVIVSHTETLRDMVDGTIDIGVDGSGMAHIEHI